MLSEVTWSIKNNPSVLGYSLTSNNEGSFHWDVGNVKQILQAADLRGRAEITKQSVSLGKKCNLLLVMVPGEKAKCPAKQPPVSRPAGRRGRVVEESGHRELQSISWHLQAAKLVSFPSPCPSPCSLPTYTHSCSLPRQGQPMSKNSRNAAPQCCGWCWGRHRNMCCLRKTALNIPWCSGEQKCETTKGTEKDFLPFPWTAGKVEGYYGVIFIEGIQKLGA